MPLILLKNQKKTLILLNSSLKLISLKCSMLIDNILVLLGRRVLNRQSAFLWVPTVLLFSSTCSFTLARQTSYKGFYRKTKRSYITFCYRWCPFTNLSHWACNKGYSYICFMPWPRNWQQRPLKSKTLRQKRWFQFSHCEHSTTSFVNTLHEIRSKSKYLKTNDLELTGRKNTVSDLMTLRVLPL